MRESRDKWRGADLVSCLILMVFLCLHSARRFFCRVGQTMKRILCLKHVIIKKIKCLKSVRVVMNENLRYSLPQFD